MIAGQPPKDVPPPTPITLSKLVLTEGVTTMHFVEALLRELAISDQIEVRNFGGIRELKSVMITIAATPGFSGVASIGVIRDAEDDATVAMRDVQAAFAAAAFPGNSPNFSARAFILPDGQQPGMIETLCVESVKDDPVYDCIEEFFRCAKAKGAALPTGPIAAKSFVQAFLATRPEVQMFPGIAAYRKYWPWDSRVFDPLKAFLRSL